MPDIDNIPKTKLVPTADGKYEEIVISCGENVWEVCCMCRLFGSCIFKGKNRVGVIPNVVDDFRKPKLILRKYKLKFFMELNNFNKNHGKEKI